MASLAESSLASVPVADVALLHERMLLQSRTRGESSAAVTTDNPPPPPPPRLSTSASAPPPDIEAMLPHQPSPSQEAFATLTHASSFHGCPGGDTQPIDTQVYRDHIATDAAAAAASINNNTTTPKKTPKKTVVHLLTSPDGRINLFQSTPRTDVEDNVGSPSADSISDGNSSASSPRADNVSRFAMPATPTTAAGNKHGRDGRILTSATPAQPTPAYSQLFGGGGGGQGANALLGATQLFNQTQAPSSPVPDVARSDPVITRPSPATDNHVGISSPSLFTTSPFPAARSRPSTSAGEPRGTQVGTVGSERRRTVRLREEIGLQQQRDADAPEDDDESDGPDDESHQSEKKRARRVAVVDLITPAKGERLESDVSEDGDFIEGQEEGGEGGEGGESDGSSDNDEYDELGQTVLRSQGNDELQHQDASDEGVEAGDEPVQHPGSQNSAIADSQPMRQERPRSLLSHHPAHGSSMSSFVPASQYASKPDRDPAEVSSKEASGSAKAVPSSTDLVDDRVPSSPPLPTASGAVPENSVEARLTRQQMPHPFQAPTVPDGSTSALEIPESDLLVSEDMQHPTGADGQFFSTAPTHHLSADQRSPEKVVGTPMPSRMIFPSQQSKTSSQQSPRRAAGIRRFADIAARSPPPPRADSGTQPDIDAIVNAVITEEDHEFALAISSPPRRPRMTYSRRQQQLARPRFFPHHDLSPNKKEKRNDGDNPIPDPRPGLLGDTRHVQEETPPASTAAPAALRVSQSKANEMPVASTTPPLREEAQVSVSTPESVKLREMAGSTKAASLLSKRGGKKKEKKASKKKSKKESKESRKNPRENRIIKNGAKSKRSSKRMRDRNGRYADASDANGHPVEEENQCVTDGRDENEDEDEDRGVSTEAAVTDSNAKSKRSKESRKDLRENRVVKNGAKSRRSSKRMRDRDEKDEDVSDADDHPVEEENQRVIDGGDEDHEAALTKSNAESKEGQDLEVPDAHDQPVEEIQYTTGGGDEDEDRIVSSEAPSTNYDARTTDNSPPIVAPDRVFAWFKGSFNAFYPARWLGWSTDGAKYRIVFDDGTITSLEPHNVARLELHVGDEVKVDVPMMRNRVFRVKRFGNLAPSDRDRADGADVYGHLAVKVQAKPTRRSLPVREDDCKPVWVNITSVYLTHYMWPHFADRTFAPPTTPTLVISSRPATPSTGLQTPNAESPNSRARRSAALGPNGRASHLREDFPAGGNGMFAGMAFAISYGSNGAQRSELERSIRRNGGSILEDGFIELFALPGINEASVFGPSEGTEAHNLSLHLKPEHRNLGFVALIADRHSRKEKYIQALALGLPALSGRWVADSVDRRRNPSASSPLPWHTYLLPAGESSYLGGAVRSRVLPIHHAEAAASSLTDTLTTRDTLLGARDGLLVVTPAAPSKKAKATWERRGAHALLALAFGAGRVGRVSSLAHANTVCKREPGRWGWIYVQKFANAACADGFGANGGGGGRKRKRGEDVVGAGAGADVRAAGDGQVRIVDDEFVVQSLILGALVD